MKSGRLLKFHRPGGDVHLYLYRDAGECRGALYVRAEGRGEEGPPTHTVVGPSEERVETEARAWIDANYPREPRE